VQQAIFLPTNPSEFIPVVCPPASLPLIEDDELVSLLEQAAESELDGLVELLDTKGWPTCQLRGTAAYRKHYPRHRFYARDIAAELQKYGGHTIVSLFRGGRGVRYHEIVQDVASKVGVSESGSTEDIESRIQDKLAADFWKFMSPAERTAFLKELKITDLAMAARAVLPAVLLKAGGLAGFQAYMASVIIANAAANAVLGHGLNFAANAALTKGLSVFLGPPGWTIAGIITAQAIGSQASRVTVPCVLQVSMIRQAIYLRQRPKPKIMTWFLWVEIGVVACVLWYFFAKMM
jgi:uncharacterized protein YaaW (UPF0174 family)